MKTLFAARLNQHPWHITPAAAQELRVLADAALTDQDYFSPRQPMRSLNGVALINVTGILAGGMPPFWEKVGNTDYTTLAAEIRGVRDDARVSAVLLRVASPGGSCMGCTEIYDEVDRLAARKPVIAYTESQMCSAAYYISSAATLIYATKSAAVGSIGTIATLFDLSESAKQMGVRVIQIASGDLKGGGSMAGYTDAQIADAKRVVQDYFVAFSGDVRKKRPISVDAMRGQYFKADCAPAGLVDYIGLPAQAAQDAWSLSGSAGGLDVAPSAWAELFASEDAGGHNHGEHGKFAPKGAGGKGGQNKPREDSDPKKEEPSNDGVDPNLNREEFVENFDEDDPHTWGLKPEAAQRASQDSEFSESDDVSNPEYLYHSASGHHEKDADTTLVREVGGIPQERIDKACESAEFSENFDRNDPATWGSEEAEQVGETLDNFDREDPGTWEVTDPETNARIEKAQEAIEAPDDFDKDDPDTWGVTDPEKQKQIGSAQGAIEEFEDSDGDDPALKKAHDDAQDLLASEADHARKAMKAASDEAQGFLSATAKGVQQDLKARLSSLKVEATQRVAAAKADVRDFTKQVREAQKAAATRVEPLRKEAIARYEKACEELPEEK